MSFSVSNARRRVRRSRLASFTAVALTIGIVGVAAPLGAPIAGASSATLSVVRPGAMHGWYFWNDKDDLPTGSPGALVDGPDTPPAGEGSVRLGPLTDSGTTAGGHAAIATNAYAGTPLAQLTNFSYSTYQTGPTLAVALQFDVKYRTTDSSYGGRLVFEPYQNGAVTVGSGWQSWSPLAGKWWASKTTTAGTGGAQVVALPAGNCAQATPCSWGDILSAFPNATIAGRLLLKAGSNWSGFDGNADNLTIGVNGTDVRFDFEADTCTSTCYVDAVDGDDNDSGASPTLAKKTIQAAIDAVDAGGTVRVLPGSYHETAANSATTVLPGTYQFGLFFPAAKPNITLLGVTGADVPVTDGNATVATVTTNATNNFGTSGVFVEAANTTIQGLAFGPNDAGDNKTIEVVADNFTLRDSKTTIPNGGGSIYIDDFSANGDVVKAYHIVDNVFPDGTSVDIASGAGNTGPVSGREIVGNTFDLNGNGFNAISFNGAGGVAWFVNPVGGAIIKHNSFANSTQYIRARGVYDNSQFDWTSYWNDNTYDRAAAALISASPTFDVRTYAYSVFTNVRSIGATVQGQVDHALSGDTVLVKAGTYRESVVISVPSVTLRGAGADLTIIEGPKTGAGNTLEVTSSSVNTTIDGVTITRDGNNTADWTTNTKNQGVNIGGNGSTLQNSRVTGNRNGVFLYGTKNVTIRNNVIDGNRTGIHLVNDVSGLTVVNNFVTDNFTIGVLFRSEPEYGANATTGIAINDNAISGNWYSQIEARVLVSSPLLDVSKNWLGTVAPTVTASATNSGEPGYAAQIPVAFGGTAHAPANSPTIVWNTANTANPLQYKPYRCSGVDASPAIGFQPTTPLCPYASGGFAQPIDNAPVTNSAKAGQTIPVKWRLTFADGTPVSDATSFVSLTAVSVACGTLATVGTDTIETYSDGAGLKYLGDGNWQFNWSTPKSYKGQCRTLVVTFNDGSTRTAQFTFK